MAINVMVKVWECEEITNRTELLLLLAMADFSDKKGNCFPSVSTLAKLSRISERQAHRVIKHLCDKKWIELVEKGGVRNGKNFSNRYRILIEGGGVTMTPGTDAIVSPGVVTPICQTIRHSEPSIRTMTKTTPANSNGFHPVVIVISSVDGLLKEFGPFNATQRKKIADQYERDADYVLRQAEIVRSEPRANAAKAFLAALRDDWQPRKVIAKPKREKRPAAIREPLKEPTLEEWEKSRAAAKLATAELKAKLHPHFAG